jgi:hypothetical protein
VVADVVVNVVVSLVEGVVKVPLVLVVGAVE